MHQQGLQKAIQFFGSQQALAAALGVSQQTISSWLTRGSIPHQYILKIISLTQGQVSHFDLVPHESEMYELLNACLHVIKSYNEKNVATSDPRLKRKYDKLKQLINQESLPALSPVLAPAAEDSVTAFEVYESIWHRLNTLFQKKRKLPVKDYPKVLSYFWTNGIGREFHALRMSVRLLALYLITCVHANLLGVFYLPIVYIAHDLNLSEKEIYQGLEQLKNLDFCSYDKAMQYVWVHEMLNHQVSSTRESKQRLLLIINAELRFLPPLLFRTEFNQKYGPLLLSE